MACFYALHVSTGYFTTLHNYRNMKGISHQRRLGGERRQTLKYASVALELGRPILSLREKTSITKYDKREMLRKSSIIFLSKNIG